MKWLLRILVAGILIRGVSMLGLFHGELSTVPQVVGGWRLEQVVVYQPVPSELRSWPSGEYAWKALRGRYVGTASVSLTVYEMPWYGHTAFDAIQQWRALPGEVAFFKDGHFGIAQSATASQEDLYKFVHSLWGGAEILR
jgi:hypothetical protein